MHQYQIVQYYFIFMGFIITYYLIIEPTFSSIIIELIEMGETFG